MFNFGFANREFPCEVEGSVSYRRELASNPVASEGTLFALAYSADTEVWDNLIDNPAISPSVAFVLLYGDDLLYENPRSLSASQREALFDLFVGFAFYLTNYEVAFREQYGDRAAEAVLAFCEEEGVGESLSSSSIT